MTDPGDQLIALIESLYDGVRPPDSDDVARVYDAVHDLRERSAEAALYGFREGASQVAHDRDEKARAATQDTAEPIEPVTFPCPNCGKGITLRGHFEHPARPASQERRWEAHDDSCACHIGICMDCGCTNEAEARPPGAVTFHDPPDEDPPGPVSIEPPSERPLPTTTNLTSASTSLVDRSQERPPCRGSCSDLSEEHYHPSQEQPPIDVERLAEAMRRIGYIVYEGDPDDDDMCPNCVTPWKCNGPHILKERPDANDEEAAKLAAEYSRLSGSVGE